MSPSQVTPRRGALSGVHHPPCTAFTLIELLIVVTIIAILAAIALPNFLEAQTRSKVSRVKSDMRALVTAVETYRVDNNRYPYRRHTAATGSFKPATAEVTRRAEQISALTTPLSYITSLPVDVFEKLIIAPNNIIDYYDEFQTTWLYNAPHAFRPSRRLAEGGGGFLLFSVGPDGYVGAYDSSCDCPNPVPVRGTVIQVYDPTNGSISGGNIYYSQQFGEMEPGARLTRQFLP